MYGGGVCRLALAAVTAWSTFKTWHGNSRFAAAGSKNDDSSASTVAAVLIRRKGRHLDQSQIVYSVRVRGTEGQVLGQLEVYRGEEAVDAVVAFGLVHGGLDEHQRKTLLRAACESSPDVRCSRRRALLYERAVQLEDGGVDLPALRVWHEQDPEDAVAAYAAPTGLTAVAQRALFEALSAAAEEAQLWALRPATHARVSLRIPVRSDDKGELGVLEVLEGREPADAVRDMAAQKGLDGIGVRQLIDVACGRMVCSRRRALAFSASPVLGPHNEVLVEADGVPAMLQVWDGEEPADAIYELARSVLSQRVDSEEVLAYARQLSDEVCGGTRIMLLPPRQHRAPACSRRRGVVRRLPIRGPFGPDKSDVHVGDLAIIDEAEAYDLAYAFAAVRGCEGCPFYHQLAASICELTTCTRRIAIAWSMSLGQADFEAVGWPASSSDETRLKVWEGEQLVDGVRSLWFLRYDFDDRALRSNLSRALCSPRASLVRRSLCARAEEIFAIVDVESPKALRVIEFNTTRRFPRNGSLLDFGIVGWSGVDDLQALGAFNDSEADVRGVGRGFKARRVDDVEVRDRAHLAVLLNVTPPLNVTFQVLDDRDKWLPGRVVLYEGSTASDAVYAACRANELLQPNYTAMGLQRDFLEAICRSPYPKSWTNGSIPGCDTPLVYEPREALFELPLSYEGLGYTFRYYAADYAKQDDPADGAAQAFCDRLGNPRDCKAELRLAVAQHLEHVEERRFSDTATPDGPDLYLALGVPRDASNETIVNAYARLADELREPFALSSTELNHARENIKLAQDNYRAATMLAKRSNTTAATASSLAVDAKRELDAARARVMASLDVDAASRRSLLAAALASVFHEENVSSVPVSSARKALEKASSKPSVLDDLVSEDFVVVRTSSPSQGQSRRPRRSADERRAQESLEITATGRDLLLGDAANTTLDWPTISILVARARAAVASFLGHRRVLENCRRASIACIIDVTLRPRDLAGRMELARQFLQSASNSLDQAMARMEKLDLTVPDISRRAHALHVAFDTLTDATNRDFYDRPCQTSVLRHASRVPEDLCHLSLRYSSTFSGRPIFGACCVRDAPDGGLRITCGSGGS